MLIIVPVLALFGAISMPEQVPVTTQFDFWVGEWDCTGKSRITAGEDKWVDTNATNSIKKILSGKVVEESFSMDGFVGHSVTAYDAQRKVWRQTWVDNSGGYLVFEGGMKGDKMILTEVSSPVPSSSKRKQRMAFSDFEGDSFTWEWEGSPDGGKTWNLNWRLNYKRKK